jgi:hypothetical protein
MIDQLTKLGIAFSRAPSWGRHRRRWEDGGDCHKRDRMTSRLPAAALAFRRAHELGQQPPKMRSKRQLLEDGGAKPPTAQSEGHLVKGSRRSLLSKANLLLLQASLPVIGQSVAT